MSELSGIRLALELATRQRDDAGRALVRADDRHRAGLDQILQLESYAGETAARWSPAAQQRPATEVVLHYYQFMARLQQATDLQRGVVTTLERERGVAQQQLLQAEVRIASLKQLLHNKLSVIARQQASREQKQTDEFAALAFRRATTPEDCEEFHER